MQTHGSIQYQKEDIRRNKTDTLVQRWMRRFFFLLVVLEEKNHIQTTSTEWAVHYGHPWCSRAFVVRLQPLERLISHMSEEMSDCKESKQSLTEVRKAERNPQEANWQLCIVNTATREKSWRLKLSPHEHHVKVTKSQLSRAKIKSKSEGKTQVAKN